MAKSKILKSVFTLKSGKSIVVSMFEEQGFKIYNEWVKFNPSENNNDVFKVVHEKKKDGVVVEAVCILFSEIAAIQIVENFNKHQQD